MIRAVVFDLDGTLADTVGDIGAAMNHALARLGLPVHTMEAYREFIGEGVHVLAARALPADRQELAGALLDLYGPRYRDHLLDTSAPYPGIPELLDALAARVPMAVLSNKPDEPTRAMVAALFGRWRLSPVLGQRPGVPRKPDPTAALEIAGSLGVSPAACAFVGDTAIDMRTAAAAGMVGIGALWGLRGAVELRAAGARALVGRPAELLDLL